MALERIAITGALRPPRDSWWTSAPPDGFTARCEQEWERMRGGKFAASVRSADEAPHGGGAHVVLRGRLAAGFRLAGEP